MRKHSMSSSRNVGAPAICAAALLVFAVACKGKEAAPPVDSTHPSAAAVDTTVAQVALRPFTGDTVRAHAGRLIFLQKNCYSCHGGLAGGAMGPSLRDTTWKYGGADSLIFHSIHDGRPMGMPAWGNQLTTDQIDELIVYIRSLRTTAEPQFFFWTETNDGVAKRS
jgi:mono/diheme cytochrome c family protein